MLGYVYLFLLLGPALVTASATSTTVRPVSKQEACNYWKTFTAQMNDIHKMYSFLRYNCTYNNTCDGAECTGSIRYKLVEEISADFCFGMRVNHCDHPLSLDVYYLDSKNSSVYLQDRVTHNDSRELKSLSKDLGAIGRIEPFLFFELTRPVPHHVLFGVKVKIRVTSAFGFQSWPEEFQQDLIQKSEIPVTPCKETNTNSPPLHPRCINTTVPYFAPTTTPLPVKINSVTYNKTCHLDLYLSCSDNEACTQTDKTSDTGVCLCANQLPLDPKTGLCSGEVVPAPFVPLTTLVPNIQPHHAEPQTKTKPINGALIGGVVGGIFVVAILVVVVIVIVKRQRSNQQYITVVNSALMESETIDSW